MDLTIECQICMDDYSQENPPSTLQCGHTFCIRCIKALIKNKKLTCPLGKEELTIIDVKQNYEMLHLITESKETFQSCLTRQKELESALEETKSEIEDFYQEKIALQNEYQASLDKINSDISKKVSSAVIEAEVKANNKLKRRLKEQEEKLISKLNKEAKLSKEIEDKKRDETLNSILKQNEENMMKLKKEKADLEKQLELEKKQLADKQKQEEAEYKKLKLEIASQMERSLKEQRDKLEEEFRNREQDLIIKQRQEIEQKKQKMEIELKEQREKIERENQLRQEKEENLKKLAEEGLKKAQDRLDKKMRTGKFPGGQEEKYQKESLQRDNERVYWAFRGPRGSYIEYFDNLSEAIERAFVRNMEFAYLKNRGTVDFFKWKEVKQTGEEVPIKRVNSLRGKAEWRYKTRDGWTLFNEQDTFDLEKAWLSKYPNCMALIGKLVDFNTLTVMIEGCQVPVIRDIRRN